MSREGGHLFRAVLVALAAAGAGASVGQLVAKPIGLGSVAWLFAAVVLYFVANAAGAQSDKEQLQDTVAGAIRTAALASARDELWKSGGISRGDLRQTIVETRSDTRSGAARCGVDQFVARVAQTTSTCRWIVIGGIGLDESAMMRQIAVAINEHPDPNRPVAVVVPLASYDSTYPRLEDWLAAEVARAFRVEEREVRRLMTEDRLFFLLEGLDTVPDEGSVKARRESRHALDEPVAEQLPGRLRRFLGRPSLVESIDPRRQLLGRLNGLRAFVVSIHRWDAPAGDDQLSTVAVPVARLEGLPREEALRHLTERVPQLSGVPIPEKLGAVVECPLYLRIAVEVCREQGLPPDPCSPSRVKAWLWQWYLDYELSTPDRRNLGWTATAVTGWLRKSVDAAGDNPLSFRRLALLCPAWVRAAMRVARDALIAVVVATGALLFVTTSTALVLAGLAFVFLVLTSEGAASQLVAPQRFGFERFGWEALRQLPYAVIFTLFGVLVGWLAGKHGALSVQLSVKADRGTLIATGAVAGFLLGILVPTLYQLYYVPESDLYSTRYRQSTVPRSVSASIRIGTLGGGIVALACYVFFQSARALIFLPIGVICTLADLLGLQLAAVVIWAVRGRGPVRIEQLLLLAADTQLAREYGQYYFLDRDEIDEIDNARRGLAQRRDVHNE